MSPGLQVASACREELARPASRERPVDKVVLGFLVWLVLSVPVAMLVCRVLKARREEMELRAAQAALALQEQ